MRAQLVVFPIRGRNWCFTRSIDPAGETVPSSSPTQLRDLLKNITSSRRPAPEKAEILVDFVSDKMNRAWANLEKAPEGTLKSKLHSLGVLLLSRVKPSEVFLKSVSKDVTGIDIAYPSSLNPRLVRRRLRHIAMRGSAIHRKYLYGSVSLLPLTSVLTVLPLPNVPFFWILFRAYSHWKALKGSERLLMLVSDCSRTWSLIINNEKVHGSVQDSENGDKFAPISPWVLKPSEDLDKVLVEWKSDNGISNSTVCFICKEHNLDKKHVLKYITSL